MVLIKSFCVQFWYKLPILLLLIGVEYFGIKLFIGLVRKVMEKSGFNKAVLFMSAVIIYVPLIALTTFTIYETLAGYAPVWGVISR